MLTANEIEDAPLDDVTVPDLFESEASEAEQGFASAVAPTVAVSSPADNTTVAPGGAVTLRATVTDSDGKVNDVRARWIYAGGSLSFALSPTATAGVYETRLTVSATAAKGTRYIEISGTDDKGSVTTSARRAILVQ